MKDLCHGLYKMVCASADECEETRTEYSTCTGGSACVLYMCVCAALTRSTIHMHVCATLGASRAASYLACGLVAQETSRAGGPSAGDLCLREAIARARRARDRRDWQAGPTRELRTRAGSRATVRTRVSRRFAWSQGARGLAETARARIDRRIDDAWPDRTAGVRARRGVRRGFSADGCGSAEAAVWAATWLDLGRPDLIQRLKLLQDYGFALGAFWDFPMRSWLPPLVIKWGSWLRDKVYFWENYLRDHLERF
uniref:Uncharacterized protein n=1 Tax=Leersia perrieri TaxID=77586 RepID=A0A0D9VKT7_9ORYZ